MSFVRTCNISVRHLIAVYLLQVIYVVTATMYCGSEHINRPRGNESRFIDINGNCDQKQLGKRSTGTETYRERDLPGKSHSWVGKYW